MTTTKSITIVDDEQSLLIGSVLAALLLVSAGLGAVGADAGGADTGTADAAYYMAEQDNSDAADAAFKLEAAIGAGLAVTYATGGAAAPAVIAGGAAY